MDDLHEVDNTNVVMELEEAAETFVIEDESETEPEPMNEVDMSELRKLHEPREPKFRHDVGSTHMKQFTLLQKMDPKRLVDDPEDDVECYAHECIHCKTCLSTPWESNQKSCKRPIEGSRSHHEAHDQRNLLSSACDEAGQLLIAHLVVEKNKVKEQ